jgi:cell division protein FtsB
VTRVSLGKIWDLVGPAIIICWTALFAYDAVAGAMGVRALKGLKVEAAEKAAEVAALEEQRASLERIADQLNPRSLDPDMVEEKIRTVLGYVAEGDVVIPREELDALLKPGEQAR